MLSELAGSARPTLLILVEDAEAARAIERAARAIGLHRIAVGKPLEQALATLGEAAPDLAVIDVDFQTHYNRHAAKRPPDCAILWLGSRFDEQVLERIDARNPHGFLTKPLEERALVDAMMRALRRHQVERERHLRKDQSDFLASLVQAMPEGVLVFDSNGMLVECNPAGREIFGLSEDGPGNIAVDDLVPANLRSGHSVKVASFLTSSDSSRRLNERAPTIAGRRSDGSTFPAQVTLLKLPEQGEVRVVAFVRDLSRERSLEAFYEKVQRSNLLERVAAVVAHDFNNMLGILRLQAERVLTQFPEHEVIVEAGREMLSAIEYGAALNERLGHYSRARTGKPRLLDLGNELAILRSLVQRIFAANVSVRWECEPDLGNIALLPGELTQIITNLAVNSRDAMPEGGVFSLRSRRVNAACVEIEVTDTGIGLSEEDQKRVFEPFYSTKRKGTGLGLAAIKATVDGCGGSVRLHSWPGQGTHVVLRLPVSELGEERADASISAPEREEGRRRAEPATRLALVVDDGPEVARSVADVLLLLGFECLIADSSVGGLRILEERGDELAFVVTDAVMPLVDGPQLLMVVRRSFPAVGLILMTGQTGFDETTDAIPETCALLRKPFSVEELSAAVEQAVQLAARVI